HHANLDVLGQTVKRDRIRNVLEVRAVRRVQRRYHVALPFHPEPEARRLERHPLSVPVEHRGGAMLTAPVDAVAITPLARETVWADRGHREAGASGRFLRGEQPALAAAAADGADPTA